MNNQNIRKMKIYSVDFEEVLQKFIPYHESIEKIQEEKSKFSNEIESIKKDMESIINSSRSLLLDEKIQMENAQRFKDLQTKAIKLESEFRSEIVELQNSELEKNYESISHLIDSWAKKADIDLVINKSSAIFVNSRIDATEHILNILKDNNLYKSEEEIITES